MSWLAAAGQFHVSHLRLLCLVSSIASAFFGFAAHFLLGSRCHFFVCR
jgi:hypothetical protein